MADCKSRVEGRSIAYQCALPDGHEGPHMAHELPRSVTARERWVREHGQQIRDQQAAEARATLAQFQGPAQTTAERYTENATPPPGGPYDATESADRIADQMRAAEERRARHEAALAQPLPAWTGPTGSEDGLEVLFRDENIVLKQLSDGAYMVEHPDGMMGQRVQPSWIEIDGGEPSEEELDRVLGEGQKGPDPFEPTKQRPGDQRLPVATGMPSAHQQAAEDLLERMAVGISRYGQPLQGFNGRNTLLDAYEESLDLVAYLRALLTMRESVRDVYVEQAKDVLREMLPVTGQYGPHVARLAEAVVDRLLDGVWKG